MTETTFLDYVCIVGRSRGGRLDAGGAMHPRRLPFFPILVHAACSTSAVLLALQAAREEIDVSPSSGGQKLEWE